jgi:hypothetical protein
VLMLHTVAWGKPDMRRSTESGSVSAFGCKGRGRRGVAAHLCPLETKCRSLDGSSCRRLYINVPQTVDILYLIGDSVRIHGAPGSVMVEGKVKGWSPDKVNDFDQFT